MLGVEKRLMTSATVRSPIAVHPSHARPGSQVQADEEDDRDETHPDRQVIPPQPAAELRRIGRADHLQFDERQRGRRSRRAARRRRWRVTLRSRSHTCAWIAASVRHAAAMTSNAAVNQPIVPLARRACQVDRVLAPGRGIMPPDCRPPRGDRAQAARLTPTMTTSPSGSGSSPNAGSQRASTPWSRRICSAASASNVTLR